MAVGSYPSGRAPIAADLNPQYIPFTSGEAFDVFRTVISQYANSPVLLALLESKSGYFDGSARFDDFYNKMWNIDTAIGFGLDFWGRVLGVTRVINIPEGETYLGFAGQETVEDFDHGIFYHGIDATSNVALSDTVYHRVLLAKAAANIWNGSLPALNAILMTLFPGYGNCWVTVDGPMTLSFRFSVRLSAIDYAIASQNNILPRPIGYIVNIVQP